jgi:hypothetical protein
VLESTALEQRSIRTIAQQPVAFDEIFVLYTRRVRLLKRFMVIRALIAT